MRNLREIKDLPIKKPTTEGINSWMLDQYFIAKSKEVNRFFGQFALPIEPAPVHDFYRL
jgi:hypothetical protein